MQTTPENLTTTINKIQVNLIWEWTQSFIAISVVLTTMISAVFAQIKNTQVSTIIAVAFGTIVGFYFARADHINNNTNQRGRRQEDTIANGGKE